MILLAGITLDTAIKGLLIVIALILLAAIIVGAKEAGEMRSKRKLSPHDMGALCDETFLND